MLKLPAALALAGALLAAAAPAAASSPLYERTLMIEADRRCGLFTPDVRAALSASRLQARTAAQRARQDASGVEGRARAGAARVPCRSADLQTAAARVRDAHAGWARLPRMDFPGPTKVWRADRTLQGALKWRLVQSGSGSAFGLAGPAPASAAPYAVALLPKSARPSLARLTVGRRVFLAETRAHAPESLALPGRGRSWAFRFSPAASTALAALPGTDTARFEVLSGGRSQSVLVKTPIEVGDFAAARTFLLQTAAP